MKKSLLIAVLASVFVLTGCATPPRDPIAMQTTTLSKPGTRIGVAMGPLPKVDTEFPGAACLLCYAAASAANSSLTSHTQKLPAEDIARIKTDLADALRKKGFTPTLLPDNFTLKDLPKLDGKQPKAEYDFASLAGKYQIDKLIVVQITQLGISRNYSSYFPTGAPQGVVNGIGYMVNLADNTYEWYRPIGETRSATGQWDEAPNFPGLTNAYFQAVEGARDAVLKPFAN
jgi:hypothetical protein